MRSSISRKPAGPVRRLLRRLAPAAVAALLIAGPGPLTVPAAASGGTLRQVTGFGSNPGNLAMYAYVPDGLPSGAPLVVALHGCTQTAGDYYAHSGWQKYADLWGFAVVFPQTGWANNAMSCFNWFDPAKDSRGNGEAQSVAEMTDYAVRQYASDTHRVYVTGLSAGGAMAADLLAAYPERFAGGSIDSGVAAQCAATVLQATGCQMNGQYLSPAQWGDKVRAANPGYRGPWPRVAIWQGSADYTVRPVNADELRDQWTDVWGIGQSPSSTRTLPGNTTLSVYDDPAGAPAVEVYKISGMGHGLAVDPGASPEQCGSTGAYFLSGICSTYYTARFWGLGG